MGDPDRAIRAFLEAVSLDPDLPFPHNGLGCVYQRKGRVTEAVVELRRALELYPEYAAAHHELGVCLLRLGDVPAAIAAFQAVLLYSGDAGYRSSAFNSLGHAYLSQDRLDEAREAFRSVLAGHGLGRVDALLQLGIVEFRQGHRIEALKLFRRYVRRAGAEASHEVHKYMAQSCLDEGRVVAAWNACRRAYDRSPDDADVHELMGRIAGHQESWAKAEAHLRNAIELSPHHASSWYHLGWVLENRGDVQGAIDAYKMAILHAPDVSHAYNNLGWLYLQQGKGDEALVIFERALEVNASDTGLLNNLGWLCADQKRYQEALEYYQRALAIEPDSGMLHCNAGSLYQQLGWETDARRELQRALELADDPQAVANSHYYLALLDRSQGCLGTAIEHLQSSLEVRPSLGAAWFRLAECWVEAGNAAAACQAAASYLAQDPRGEFGTLALQVMADHCAQGVDPGEGHKGRAVARGADAVARAQKRKRPGEGSPGGSQSRRS